MTNADGSVLCGGRSIVRPLVRWHDKIRHSVMTSNSDDRGCSISFLSCILIQLFLFS